MKRDVFLLFFLLFCFLFIIQTLRRQQQQEDTHTRTIIQTDTIVKHDTITRIEPRPVRVVRVKYDTITTTTTQHDTITAVIPIEQRTYSDSNYYAVISGYKPTLDTIKVFNNTNVITRQINTTHIKKRVFNVGAIGGIGYGFTSKQIEPFVGVGVSVNLFK